MENKKIKLNLGCGKNYKEGYVNCDHNDKVRTDKIVDLENKLPFETSSIDEILIYHVLEHIDNFIDLIHELHRISKAGAVIRIKCPFYSSWGQFNDPTHIRFFTPQTFNYFNESWWNYEVNSSGNMFDIKVKINFAIGRLKKLNWLFNPLINFNHEIYCRFFAFIFPSSEIYYELTVLK